MRRKGKGKVTNPLIFLVLGVLGVVVGLFMLVYPSTMLRTLPYEELSEATVKVQEVDGGGRYSLGYIVDADGVIYYAAGLVTPGWSYKINPGDTVTIKYQPDYMQELWLDGEKLMSYLNDDTAVRIFFPSVGGIFVIFGMVLGFVFAIFLSDGKNHLKQETKPAMKKQNNR